VGTKELVETILQLRALRRVREGELSAVEGHGAQRGCSSALFVTEVSLDPDIDCSAE
jgi:hypothetical protein